MPPEPNVALVSDDGAERVVLLQRAGQISDHVRDDGDREETEICFVMGAPDPNSAEATARNLVTIARPMRCPAR